MEQSPFPIAISLIVRNGWRPVLLFIFLFIVGAVVLHTAWPVKYEATSVLTVSPVTDSSESVNMDTERVVARSDAVLGKAVNELGSKSVSELRDMLVVSVPKGSNVLQFSVTDSNPGAAANAANAIAKAYGSYRTSSAQAVVDAAIESITTRIAELEKAKSKVREDSIGARAIDLQMKSLQERQAALTATTYYPGSIVSSAVPPSRSLTPGLMLFIAGGLFTGLMVGTIFAITRERFRATQVIRSPSVSQDKALLRRRS